jgi:CheY-like chemotaxis protein
LSRDCAAHEELVRQVVLARKKGELEHGVALRTCALELHSVKGVAGLMGMGVVVQAIDTLSDVMLKGGREVRDGFWPDFGDWFASLLACIQAHDELGIDQKTLDTLARQRDALLAMLGTRAEPQKAGRVQSGNWPPLSPSMGRRLLIVDDSPTVRAVLSAKLLDRGYPVRAARTLAETADLLEQWKPEIVVTDVSMPDVEGDELCRRIKAHMTRIVPVILYSSLPEAELALRAAESCADGYVSKTSGVDALIARMDELLSNEILF